MAAQKRMHPRDLLRRTRCGAARNWNPRRGGAPRFYFTVILSEAKRSRRISNFKNQPQMNTEENTDLEKSISLQSSVKIRVHAWLKKKEKQLEVLRLRR